MEKRYKGPYHLHRTGRNLSFYHLAMKSRITSEGITLGVGGAKISPETNGDNKHRRMISDLIAVDRDDLKVPEGTQIYSSSTQCAQKWGVLRKYRPLGNKGVLSRDRQALQVPSLSIQKINGSSIRYPTVLTKNCALHRYCPSVYRISSRHPIAMVLGSVTGFAKDKQRKMKRQRIAGPECFALSVSAEETALNVLLTDKATVVISCPYNAPPTVSVINDQARQLLSTLLLGNGSQSQLTNRFWSVVNSTSSSGKANEEDFTIDGSTIRVKYVHSLLNRLISLRFRSMQLKLTSYVIATAKVKKNPPESNLARLFFQQGPNELDGLANAVEEDIVGVTLGMRNISITLVEMHQRGLYKFLAANKIAAEALGYNHPSVLRGKTTAETGQQVADVNAMYDLWSSNLDPETKMSSFAISKLKQFPHITWFCEFKEVMPNVFIGLSLCHNRNQRLNGPRSALSPGLEPPKVFVKNRWDEFIEETIRFVSENPEYASTTRELLPDEFLRNSQNVFCYVFRGEKGFLPSGNCDGYIWKSSRGATCAGNLQKRYFYIQTPQGHKLRRRVVWMEDVKNFSVIEYKHFNHSGTTETQYLSGPPCMDWRTIISRIHAESTSQQFTSVADNINSRFDMGALRSDSNSNHMSTNHVLSYVNHILHNWASENNPPLLS
ncbi:hypothetical protein PROFUN_10187 [Planoprotostelium fungivorum]|uniref:Uncharacterized protein n=1 Tax=Planoprotostelium fungivorum TaxID=1890364 RepID=A0A2P6MQ46_9EUKA|nr:hypothetical protein PROFUN_10187 [Planoprotostelium fungivorum]